MSKQHLGVKKTPAQEKSLEEKKKSQNIDS